MLAPPGVLPNGVAADPPKTLPLGCDGDVDPKGDAA